jgi:hypothetical protein
VGRPGERHDAVLCQGDGHRRRRQDGGAFDQRLGGGEELRVVVDERSAAPVQPDRGGQRYLPGADADAEEVGVGGPPFPEAVGPVDQRPEPGKVGVEPVGDRSLGGGDPPHGGTDPLQVGEVAGALAPPGAAGGAPLQQPQAEPEPDRGQRRPGHPDQQPEVARTGHGQQEPDGAGAAQHRDEPAQPGDGAHGRGGRGRGGDHDLGVERRPGMDAGRPVDGERTTGRWVGGGHRHVTGVARYLAAGRGAPPGRTTVDNPRRAATAA